MWGEISTLPYIVSKIEEVVIQREQERRIFAQHLVAGDVALPAANHGQTFVFVDSHLIPYYYGQDISRSECITKLMLSKLLKYLLYSKCKYDL